MASEAVLSLLITLKDQASSGLASLGGALSSIGGIAAGAALGGVAALGAGLISGVGDARDAAIVLAQTEAVIASTGGAAGKTAQEIADYAGALSAASGASLFGDSQIQEAQNLLLTFTNIKNTTLDAATAIAVDMAQALGGEPQSQAVALGKALNDPIAGISALSRVGVTFSEQQKEQIATMVAAGDVAGAQAVILAELNKEFGGSAAAAAAADGGMAQFNDRMGELWESLGAMVLPILNQFMDILNGSVMPVLEQVAGRFEEAGGFTLGLGSALNLLIGAVTGTHTTVGFFVTDALDALLEALSTAATFVTGTVIPFLLDMGQKAVPIVSAAVATLATFWRETLQPALADVFLVLETKVLPILADLSTLVLPVLGAAVALLAGVWVNVLAPALDAAWNFFKNYILPILAQVAHWLAEEVPPAIKKATDFFNTQILPAIRTVHGFMATQFIPILQDGVKWISNVATTAGELASAMGENLQRGIRLVADLFAVTLGPALSGAQSLILGAATWFRDISGAVEGAVGWVRELADTISNIEIPDWLQGQSPPPLADWFSYVADAARDVSAALPDLAGIDVTPPSARLPAGAGGAADAGGGGSAQRVLIEFDAGAFRAWLRAEVTTITSESAQAGRARGRV